ncbi:TPA: recombinase family protein, partial [Klebsiella pneumoniae]|nr:recombinase family protein [Klebsiella pneumoniae]HDG8011290.1 recombinase family protein [Klebsiella pneumoniae]
MNIFAYCRVSRSDLSTANQKLAIERSGYKPTHVYEEQVSGSVCAVERPVFAEMI